jgi:WD40 repeat protein
VKELRSSLDGSVLLVVPFTGPTFCARLTGHRERRHLAGHVGGVPGLAFSADGRTLASTGKDATIRLWDVQTGQLRRTWSIPRGGQGQSIGFSPDGRWLASGNYQNNQVLVWAVEDGRLVLTLDEDRWPQKGTWSAVFSPDGRILVAAGTGGVRGWELVAAAAGSPGPALFARELFRDPGGARNLAFHPSGEWIAFEGTVRRDGKPFTGSFIRRLGDGEKLERFNTHNSAVQSLGIDAVGRTLVHMTSDRVFHFFDLQSHTSVRDLSSLSTTETSSTYILNFKISKDGSKVAVANHNGRGINIHDLASGRRLYTLPDDAGSIWWLDWHPDGRHLAVARGDGDISLWSLDEVESVLAEAGVGP